jgi:hypothetical protein
MHICTSDSFSGSFLTWKVNEPGLVTTEAWLTKLLVQVIGKMRVAWARYDLEGDLFGESRWAADPLTLDQIVRVFFLSTRRRGGVGMRSATAATKEESRPLVPLVQKFSTSFWQPQNELYKK